MRKDLGFAFCREESDRNPFVAGPLKRTDCSLVSDGAAALVKAGASVETLYYPNEGHGFYLEANRAEYARRLLAFLSRHLGGGVATAPTEGAKGKAP